MSKLQLTQDSRTTYDKKTGAVRSFFGAELVNPLPAAKRRLSVLAKADDFLKVNHDPFHLDNITLKKADVREGAASRSIRYVQQHNTIPVYHAAIVVGQQKAEGNVISAMNSVDYDLPKTLGPEQARLSAENVVDMLHQRFDKQFEAITLAAPTLYVYRHPQPAAPDPHRPQPEIRQTMLALATGQPGKAYLVWQVLMDTREPSGEWELMVDAAGGELIAVNDRRMDASPKGNVFWPDPIRSKQDGTLSWATPQDTLNEECVEVDIPNLDAPVASKYKLNGTWVESVDYQSPTFKPPETSGDFKYGSKTEEFLSVMAYYYLDRLITDLRALGCTEFSSAATKVKVDAQGYTIDNSSSTQDSSGNLIILLGEGGVPDASDPAVVVHEYGHSVYRLMGVGMSSPYSYEQGWCDLLAACWLDRFNEHQFEREEVFAWDNCPAVHWDPTRRLDRTERFGDPGFDAYGHDLKGSIYATALWDWFLNIGGDSASAGVRKWAADEVLRTLVCGHYDCIMEHSADATARAPGADDNAAGIAVILEIARILNQVELRDDVQFLAFSGEEQGFWGSTAYAQYVHDNNIDVHRLINLDQVGYPMVNGGVVIEYDIGNQVAANDSPSKQFAGVMAQMAADYCTTPVMFGPIYGSDYMPFEARGYVVIGVYEGEGNPHYHDASDTPSTVNFACVADVARMTLATVLHETASVTDESGAGVDLYIRDSDADTGLQPSELPHWTSPDIWVRNNPPPADPADPNDPDQGEDPEAGHQAPINNTPNYLYVRVHHRGSQAAAGFSVKAYHCDPGTGMIWPDNFDLIGVLPVPLPVPPDNMTTTRIGPFIWTPQIDDHECLLAIVSGPGDHAIPDIYSGQIEHGLLVRYDNNVGQRNVTPAPSTPGGKTKTSFLIRGTTHLSSNTLELDAALLPPDTKIALRLARNITDSAKTLTGFVVTDRNSRWTTLALPGGVVGAIASFSLDAGEERSVHLEIDFSCHAEHLKRYPIIASQEQDGMMAGRLTIEITAVKESEDYFYGNSSTQELHTFDCGYRKMMNRSHQVPFETIKAALARGYNGCAFCLPAYDADRENKA